MERRRSQATHLAAMIPWQGTHDFYRDRTRQDGIFSAGFPNSWRPRSVLLVDVIAGLKAVGSRRLFPMRALKASGWQIFVKVRVPGMLPYLVAGLVIGIVFAIIGAIVAEFAGSSSGLGSLVIKRQSAIDMGRRFLRTRQFVVDGARPQCDRAMDRRPLRLLGAARAFADIGRVSKRPFGRNSCVHTM